MKMPLAFLQLSLLLMFFASTQLSAEERLTSDWLSASAGSSGDKINAKVVNVDHSGDVMAIDILIPIDRLENYETIDIIDKKTNKPVKLFKKPHHLSDENDIPSGIRFHTKRIPGFEFRIELRDDTNEILP